MKAIDECVEAVLGSIKWLDENKPNWARQINLDSFSFIDPTRCISGQLGLSDLESHSSHGFNSPLRTDDPDFDESYVHMESLWRVFINKRTAR